MCVPACVRACVRASVCAPGVIFEANKCILCATVHERKNVSKIRTVITFGGTRYHGCRMAFTIHNPIDLTCVGLDNYN